MKLKEFHLIQKNKKEILKKKEKKQMKPKMNFKIIIQKLYLKVKKLEQNMSKKKSNFINLIWSIKNYIES